MWKRLMLPFAKFCSREILQILQFAKLNSREIDFFSFFFSRFSESASSKYDIKKGNRDFHFCRKSTVKFYRWHNLVFFLATASFILPRKNNVTFSSLIRIVWIKVTGSFGNGWVGRRRRKKCLWHIYLVVLLFKRCFHFCYLKEVIKPNKILFLLTIHEI